MLGLRLSTFLGIGLGLLSFVIAIYYTGMKFLYWDDFPMGLAPLTIGFFLFMSLIFLFIGLMYYGLIVVAVSLFMIVI
jgi:hypothetical protein